MAFSPKKKKKYKYPMISLSYKEIIFPSCFGLFMVITYLFKFLVLQFIINFLISRMSFNEFSHKNLFTLFNLSFIPLSFKNILHIKLKIIFPKKSHFLKFKNSPLKKNEKWTRKVASFLRIFK